MKLRWHLIALGLALLAAACSTLKTHHVVTGRPGAPTGAPVITVMQGSPVPFAYQEVAIVQAVGTGSDADLEHIVKGLQQEAASLGANAVINVQIDQGSGQASGTGVAVRRLAGRAAPPPPAPQAPQSHPPPPALAQPPPSRRAAPAPAAQPLPPPAPAAPTGSN